MRADLALAYPRECVAQHDLGGTAVRTGHDIHCALRPRAFRALLVVALDEETEAVAQLDLRSIARRAVHGEVVSHDVNVVDVAGTGACGDRDSERLKVISLHQRVRVPAEKDIADAVSFQHIVAIDIAKRPRCRHVAVTAVDAPVIGRDFVVLHVYGVGREVRYGHHIDAVLILLDDVHRDLYAIRAAQLDAIAVREAVDAHAADDEAVARQQMNPVLCRGIAHQVAATLAIDGEIHCAAGRCVRQDGIATAGVTQHGASIAHQMLACSRELDGGGEAVAACRNAHGAAAGRHCGNGRIHLCTNVGARHPARVHDVTGDAT